MDRAKTGFVGEAELRACYKRSAVNDATRDWLVGKMLDSCDEDADGRISYDEWTLYLCEAESSGKYTICHWVSHRMFAAVHILLCRAVCCCCRCFGLGDGY